MDDGIVQIQTIPNLCYLLSKFDFDVWIVQITQNILTMFIIHLCLDKYKCQKKSQTFRLAKFD